MIVSAPPPALISKFALSSWFLNQLRVAVPEPSPIIVVIVSAPFPESITKSKSSLEVVPAAARFELEIVKLNVSSDEPNS